MDTLEGGSQLLGWLLGKQEEWGEQKPGARLRRLRD